MNIVRMAFALLLLVAAMTSGATQEYPKPIGYVSDFAHLLAADQSKTLDEELSAFEKQNGLQIVIVTVDTLNGESIEEYARGLGNAWGVGKRENNDGIVFLIAPKERKVRIATGEGIRHVVLDERAKKILREVIVPSLKADNWPQGIIDGTHAIMRTIDENINATPIACPGGSTTKGEVCPPVLDRPTATPVTPQIVVPVQDKPAVVAPSPVAGAASASSPQGLTNTTSGDTESRGYLLSVAAGIIVLVCVMALSMGGSNASSGTLLAAFWTIVCAFFISWKELPWYVTIFVPSILWYLLVLWGRFFMMTIKGHIYGIVSVFFTLLMYFGAAYYGGIGPKTTLPWHFWLLGPLWMYFICFIAFRTGAIGIMDKSQADMNWELFYLRNAGKPPKDWT